MKISAVIMKLKVRFRPIEDWFGMSLILALAGGAWVPVPGNLYPKEDTWTYRDIAKKLGVMAFMGTFIIVASTWLIYLIPLIVSIPSAYDVWFDIGLRTGATLSFLETALPFFPLEVYNGKRIWNLNKFIWLILTCFGVTIFVITFLIR